MYMKTNKCISIVVLLVSISTFASFDKKVEIDPETIRLQAVGAP